MSKEREARRVVGGSVFLREGEKGGKEEAKKSPVSESLDHSEQSESDIVLMNHGRGRIWDE